MDWQATKFVLGFFGLLILWFLSPIVSGLVKVWRVWTGKDETRTRVSKHETLL